MTTSSANNVILLVERKMLENKGKKYSRCSKGVIHLAQNSKGETKAYDVLCITLHVHMVTLIIVPSFSRPSSRMLLYIVGSNGSCL